MWAGVYSYFDIFGPNQGFSPEQNYLNRLALNFEAKQGFAILWDEQFPLRLVSI